MIKLKNIQKSFDGNIVLEDINLEIKTGETLLILGQSGSGKSVTLKLILRLLEPDFGSIIIDDEDTTLYSERKMMQIRKKIGMLFQGAALFDSMTVWENLAYPLREHTDLSIEEIDVEVQRVLGFVNMLDTDNKIPSELSGGMKKRIGLARAMITRPDYIFYDEPTTGLDPITAARINDLIVRSQEEYGVTSIVVTHDLVSAFYVGDRFSFLNEGKIIFVGSADEIRQNEHPAIQNFLREAQWKNSKKEEK